MLHLRVFCERLPYIDTSSSLSDGLYVRRLTLRPSFTTVGFPSPLNFDPTLVRGQTSTVEPLLPSSTIVRSLTNSRYNSGCSVCIGISRFGFTWAIVSLSSVGIMWPEL